MLIYNFDYFVKVQIWKNKNLFRFHVETTNEPMPDFKKVQKDWKYKTSFYAFSSQYRGILSRNYRMIHYLNNNTAPYETIDVISIYDVQNYGDYENYGGFIVFQNPVQDQFQEIKTIPLLLFRNENSLGIFIRELEDDVKKWYNTKFKENMTVYHVFKNDPSSLHYWRNNQENVCLPTSFKNKEYFTIIDCVKANSIDILKNKNTFVGTNSKAVYDIYQQEFKKNEPKNNTNLKYIILYSCIGFSFLLFLCSSSLWIMKQQKKNSTL